MPNPLYDALFRPHLNKETPFPYAWLLINSIPSEKSFTRTHDRTGPNKSLPHAALSSEMRQGVRSMREQQRINHRDIIWRRVGFVDLSLLPRQMMLPTK